MSEPLAFEVQLNQPYQQAVQTVTAALKDEGFGIMTEVDVRATLKEKLDVDFRPYVILGACNPHLAHQALTAEPLVGMMLPCNVTVEAASDESSLVRLFNPRIMAHTEGLAENPGIKEVAEEAHAKLSRVVQALEAG